MTIVRVLDRWLHIWLGLWRWHHVRIASPLRPAAAVVRLREAVAELPTAVPASGRRDWFRARDRSRGVDVDLSVTTRRGWTVVRLLCRLVLVIPLLSPGHGPPLPLYVVPLGMLLFGLLASRWSVVEGSQNALIALDHIAGRVDASS